MLKNNVHSAVTLATCHLIKNTHAPFILIPQENESIFQVLQQCASIVNLQSALVSGIGSIKQVELGFYDHAALVLNKKIFADIYEIVSLSGSITHYDNDVFVHLHGAFSDGTYQTVGGHMIEARAGAATELYITPLAARVERIFDKHMGIKRIQCSVDTPSALD